MAASFRGWLLIGVFGLSGCAIESALAPAPTVTSAAVLSIDGRQRLPDLPEAVSNNAVAAVALGPGHFRLYSFMGLLAGRTWRDVTDRAFEYDSKARSWRELEPVPGGVGRLAATAQTVRGQVYVFGGYTVAEDGTEASTPQVFRFDPLTRRYSQVSQMPVPVDDAVSGVYRDRYIYLISGWHDTDNVSNVQVFDTQTLAWLQATPFPGPPVFGHAGGLSADQLLICDGVKVVPGSQPGEPRRFVMSHECWRGRLDAVDPGQIDWQPISHHPGPPLYRAASCASSAGEVVIVGGTDNPFNYNGIGYDGVASAPRSGVYRFAPGSGGWAQSESPAAAMDQRGCLIVANGLTTIGGMVARAVR